jgi:CrcB protein
VSQHTGFALLIIFLGGGIGSMLRHSVNQAAVALLGVSFPWGTLFVNIAGSFAMGLVAGWFAFHGGGGQMLRLFLATGVLGGFTTFSAFSLDAALLLEKGQTAAAATYVVFSVVAAVAGVFAGVAIMRALLN